MKSFKDARLLLGVAAVLVSAGATALPVLQLDIGGGTYDTTNEDVVSSATSATVYALLNEKHGLSYNSTNYVLWMSLEPKASASDSVGSISVDGTNYTFGNYGNPGIPSHGVFDTRYSTLTGWNFDCGAACGTASPYNVEDNPGGPDSSGSGSYYRAFTVDTSNLADDWSVHFDLAALDCTKGYCVAPFSHDATITPGTPPTEVPEPGALGLLGIGLIGLGLARRRRRS